jgi:conjugal transfer pilin signal peptidase TrbI
MLSRNSTTAGAPPIELRSPKWWMKGLGKVAIAFLLVYIPIQWFGASYRFAFDMIEGVNCLPETFFLIDLNDQNVGRGDYVAFRTEQMEPFYENGTTAIKILAGVAGDQVDVDATGATVNDKYWGPLHHIRPEGRLTEMGRSVADYTRSLTVPEGEMWMMAPHERSYDSRYWGTIREEQVIGRVIPLF